jgi:hypothetical protein
MSKIQELIERLKKAKDVLNKDDIDDKIRTKMLAEMNRRGMTGADIANHYRDIDENIPAKQRSNIKQSIKAQKQKEVKPKLTVVKSVEKTVDGLIKSLEDLVKANEGPRMPNMPNMSNTTEVKPKVNPIKPGPTLDYRKINPPKDYQQMDADAPKIVYDKSMSVAPKRYAGAKERADAVRAKIEAESKESALDTMRRRGQTKKSEDEENKLAKSLSQIVPGIKLQPTNEDIERALIGSGMAFTEDQLKKSEENYTNGMQNWFTEALKPISSRFANEEEELAYWNSIGVRDGDNGGSGY